MHRGGIPLTQKNTKFFLYSQILCLFIASFFLLSPNNLHAQNTNTEKSSPLTIKRAALATSIVEREPTGIADSFSRDIGKIYCFTHIQGANEPTIIYHRWYFEEKLMAEVTLAVKSNNWRTYSSKQIMYRWIGDWFVEVVDDEGIILKTLHFTID